MPTFTTKELSKRTWPDFRYVFSQGNGWDFCACMPAHRAGVAHVQSKLRRAERTVINHREKKALVDAGQAHGILVYADGEPVGWCQFGPRSELPHWDAGLLNPDDEQFWRITCFCTRPEFAQQGVAGRALLAALAAIRKRGGGVVEGYAVAHVVRGPGPSDAQLRERQWMAEYRRLVRKHGTDLHMPHARELAKHDEKLRLHLAKLRQRSGLDRVGGGREIEVKGVGKVNAVYWGRYHGGTVAMFEREGFRAVAAFTGSERTRIPPPHPSMVVMRKVV